MKTACLSFTFLVTSVAFCFDLLAGPPSGPLGAFGTSRKWRDSAGKFSIDASMEHASSTEVKLKKADGKIVTVPLSKLSEADRMFVESFLEAEAAFGGSEEDNPFAGGDDAESSMPATKAKSPGSKSDIAGSDFDSIPKVTFSSNRAKPINFDYSTPFWNVEVNSLPTSPALPDSITNVPLSKDFFDKLQLQVSRESPVGFVSIYRTGRSESENYSRLGMLRFPDGDPVALGQSSLPWKILGVAPNGKSVALVRDEGWDKGNDVAIIDMEGDQAIPRFQFVAGGGSWDELHWGSFLDHDRFVIISQKHVLKVWNLKEKTVQMQGATSNCLYAASNANNSLLAFPAAGRVALVDSESFKQVGLIVCERSEMPTVAFSPDGKKLATFLPFVVSIYSMNDGQLIRSIAVGREQVGLAIDWIGEDHVIIDKQLVVDTKRGFPVWNYQCNHPRAVSGNRIYVIQAGKQPSILGLALPHDAAARAAERMSPDSILAVKKGSTVALSTNLQGLSPQEQEQSKNAIQTKLVNLGFKISSSASIQYHLSLAQGDVQEEEYGESNTPFPVPFGRVTGPTTKVTFRPWYHTLLVTVDGQEVFRSVQTVASPGSVQLKEGETIQQAVNRHVQPSARFFESMSLPFEIVQPKYRNGLGESRITEQGIR